MATNQRRHMVYHLRDMFNGSFDDDIIESILIQRDWNVDRALDDLMALTSGCSFTIPVEDFDVNDQSQFPEFSEFFNKGNADACTDVGLVSSNSKNFYAADHHSPSFECVQEGEDVELKNESDDDVIVLNQEEYCLSADSSEEETASASGAAASEPMRRVSPSTIQPDNSCPKISYAAAAAPIAPSTVSSPQRVKPPRIVYTGYTSYDQIKRTRDSLERVKLFVQEGFKIMVLLRGCPGSGKSYLAQKILEECGIQNNAYQHIHSTDNYFHLNKKGLYVFEPEKLSEAHRWNQINVLYIAREGLTPIVVDNTNTQMWEMSAYARIAVCAGYEIEVMEPDTPWAFKVTDLAHKNRHGIHASSINTMLARYEHNISALNLLKCLNLEYAYDKVPPKVGVRQLTSVQLRTVFENIQNIIDAANTVDVAAPAPDQNVANVEATSQKKLSRAERKKLAKAEKKKFTKEEKAKRKREKRLMKMLKEVRLENFESDDEDESSSVDLYRDGFAAGRLQTFISADLKERTANVEPETSADADAASEGSWVTVDMHDDYDDNNLSDEANESDSEADDEEKDSSSSSSSSSSPSRTPSPLVPSSSQEASSGTSDCLKLANDSTGAAEKAASSVNVDQTGHTDYPSVNAFVDDMKNSESDRVPRESTNSSQFSTQLYDALAKNGPRLKCFENLRSGDESSSEPSTSKDSTMENISRKLEELDIELEAIVTSSLPNEELEISTELLDNSQWANTTNSPATDDESLLQCDEDVPGGNTIDSNELLVDILDCTSDSNKIDDCVSDSNMIGCDTLLNVEMVEPKDSNATKQSDSIECKWVGLENCVNLPSNVRIEKNIAASELLSTGIKINADSALEQIEDHNLKICDVIPSCLINEVVTGSSVDVSLNEQLKQTNSIPTVKNWETNCWLDDFQNKLGVTPGQQLPTTDSSVDDTNASTGVTENEENVTCTDELGEATVASILENEPSDDNQNNVEEGSPNEQTRLMTESKISSDLFLAEESETDVITDRVSLEGNSVPAAEKCTNDCLPTNSPLVSDVPLEMQKKDTSLTSAIKNWLSSNPLNEPKNNAVTVTLDDQPKGRSFSSAIKNWVSGNFRNDVKTNVDIPNDNFKITSPASSALAPPLIVEDPSKQTNSLVAKNWADESPTKLKPDNKSPIRGVKNKLCNVETEICNEADLLQTMLRQEMCKKKRIDNGVNVDDVNVASKFDRDVESGGVAGTNVVRNIFDGTCEDVNLFGEWNRVEKNQTEFSPGENEGDSENSDYGSNSSSSDEMRTITDVHNSVTRFVNNDINRDAGAERKKPDVNHEVGSRQLKNKNVASFGANTPGANTEGELSWSVDSNALELNTLKERILINSFDKVFSQNNLELDCEAVASEDTSADVKRAKKPTLSGGFQMIENKLNSETANDDEAASKVENVASETDEKEVSFWNQWIRGESWDEKVLAETVTADKVESKPPRSIHNSPISMPKSSKLKNNETGSGSCWLVNDIKSSIDVEKNCQKLPKTSNFLSSGDPFLQAKELREFVDDQKFSAAVKRQNRAPAPFDFLDERTDESKNLRQLSDEFTDVFMSGKRKHSDVSVESAGSAKWDHPVAGELKCYNLADSSVAPLGILPTSPSKKQQQQQQQPLGRPQDSSSSGFFDRTVKVSGVTDEWTPPVWKYRNNSLFVDYNTNPSNCWPKSPSKTLPAFEKEFSMDENQFERKQKPSEVSNFFIPTEVLHLGQNKATNTGASDVGGNDRHLVGCCREINEGGRAGGGEVGDDEFVIGARYNSDKSTMTEGKAYTVKAKPLREDLSNMFPREMADAILDLYEKCNGNMDWIIEILMEDGYSPSDDQLEYLSSLQNVVEYRKPTDASTIKEKPQFEKKKKNKSKNRNRKNEAILKGAVKKNVTSNRLGEPPQFLFEQKFINVPMEKPANTPREIDEENLLGTTVYEDTFDDSVECVDLFIDWTTVSQLIKYFGNPTVYPIQDYQPVIKLPVSLARQLHAHLIESVIDQAEKNEDLMNQLNSEVNAGPADCSRSHELSQNDLADVEKSFFDYLVVPARDKPAISTKFVEKDGIFCCAHEEEPIPRSEDSFASKFSLNLLMKAFPTINSSFVKDTFRSQNFSYFKTKTILSQYKDEVPLVNMKEASLVGVAEATSSEDNAGLLSDNDIQLFDSSVMNSSSREEILAQVQKFREDAAAYFLQWKNCHEKLKTALRDKRYGVASHCREIMEDFKQKYERCNAHAASLLVTSCCFQNENIIDLHFFKVVEALRALDIFLDHHITKLSSSGRQKAILYVITGRGTRSIGNVSHLQPPVIQRLKQRDIELCIESTNTGLVKAVIRKTSLLSRDL